MTDVKHYTYRVLWSAEDGEFVATVAEFPSLSWLDLDQGKALAGLVGLVGDVVADMESSGEFKFPVRHKALVRRGTAREYCEHMAMKSCRSPRFVRAALLQWCCLKRLRSQKSPRILGPMALQIRGNTPTLRPSPLEMERFCRLSKGEAI